MKSLNLGKETGHEHQDDEHADHDHRGLRLRSGRQQQTRNERNTTWDQVSKERWRPPYRNLSSQMNEMLPLPVVQLCFSAEELILIHELGANASSDMGRSGLARLSPALVQQILSGACGAATDSHASDGLSTAESQCVFWPLTTPTALEQVTTFSFSLQDTYMRPWPTL